MGDLYVFREFHADYERVGKISVSSDGSPEFEYDEAYLHSDAPAPISMCLPLSNVKASAKVTRAYFDGLVPEGPMREVFTRSLRTSKNDYLAVLEAVRNEPIGALLFSTEDNLGSLEKSYEPVDADGIARLAVAPAPTALDYSLKSRISLAGAQSKIGLYCNPDEDGVKWFLPRGAAPSTHILKACGEAYPNETINEAVCLRAAKRFGLNAPDCFLIHTDASPILAIERYDRRIPKDGGHFVDGLAVPIRLHQIDMCQAWGVVGADFKYEPTKGYYLNRLAKLIRENSSNAFEDKVLMAYMQIFHYAVGNTDNHLKNWSFLYDEDWKTIRLAPIYDVLDTMMYKGLPSEMGVSFGGTRRITDVNRDAVVESFLSAGVPKQIVGSVIYDAEKEIPECIRRAAADLAEEGFPKAEEVSRSILEKMDGRLRALEPCGDPR